MLYCLGSKDKKKTCTVHVQYTVIIVLTYTAAITTFLKTIFDLWLVESLDAEPSDMEDQLCIKTSCCIPKMYEIFICQLCLTKAKKKKIKNKKPYLIPLL